MNRKELADMLYEHGNNVKEKAHSEEVINVLRSAGCKKELGIGFPLFHVEGGYIGGDSIYPKIFLQSVERTDGDFD